jgi:potassium efflux system protein
MRVLKIALAALCAVFLSLSAALALDPAALSENDQALNKFRTSLDGITEKLRNPTLSEEELLGHRLTIEDLRTGAVNRSASIAGWIAEVNQQVKSLGEPPAPGASEDAGIAKTRADLIAMRDRLQSLKSQFDVIAVEAGQSAGRVSTLQRDQFLERIFDGNRSILNPSLWYDMAAGLGVLLKSIGLQIEAGWAEVGPRGNPLGLLIIPVCFLIFAAGYQLLQGLAKRWVSRFSSRGRAIDDITRLWRIARALITVSVVPLLLLVPMALALEASGYDSPKFDSLWGALEALITGGLFFYVLALRIAAPGEPDWRIVDLDDRAASRFTLLATIAALAAIFHNKHGELAETLNLNVVYTVAQSALTALVQLSLLSLILVVVRNQDGLTVKTGRKLYFGWVAALVPVLWALIIISFIALLLGYVAFASYISNQLVQTAMVLGVLFVIYHLVDAAVTSSFDPQSGFGVFMRRVTGLGERSIERMGLILRTGADLLLLIVAVPVLVVIWTLTWVDFPRFINALVEGVKIGEITISPGLVLMVLAILAIGVALTKLFNRWLARRILNDTRINRGVQDSILKASTYLGYLIAAVLALTATGVDFSSLALIAGALGVGIGLGLQSIVNNFVSGLIILAERPIRVGDWVSLPAGEGLVRRINVRSTEIETFDSCSIVLPNSLLVTEPVRNWTHHDNMGRFLVAVTVDYDVDAQEVRRLLLETVREHERVLSAPEPSALLVRFGPGGLDFELRAWVADVFEAAVVASDVRFRLLTRFREKGITIATPVGLMQAAKR